MKINLMELTRKQEEGLKIALERYKSREPYTVISGYAGTGKTTLVKFIVAALGFAPEDVAYVTFTGKAAEVLREKGNPNAMTAHKLLYYSKPTKNGKYIHTPRKSIGYPLIVVDEVSMLPKNMWDLLLTHRKYVIACGDPFQIPPIDKTQDNHVLDNPHIFLDEIMRQAKESDIIRLSMDIREQRTLTPYRGHDAQVFNKTDLVEGMYFWADQILTATNRARFNINEFMREYQGRGLEPEIGDKIICLRNCWDVSSKIENNPLVNGTIGWIDSMELTSLHYKTYKYEYDAPVLMTTINTKTDQILEVPIDYKALVTGEKHFSSEQEYYINKMKELNPPLPIEFNYGYAITGHRAQGSQWGKVLVLEEGFPYDKIEHARWLYTGVTRAANKLTLVLDN